MSELRELYQEVIVEHNKSPRNFKVLEQANRKIEGFNPLCGDQLTLYLILDDDNVIQDISFEGSGCAISVASASLMTELLKGKKAAEAENTFQKFHAMVTDPDSETDFSLGKLAVLAGVREFPARIKCATLAWHSLHSALTDEDADSVTTE